MAETRPLVAAELTWSEQLRFDAASGRAALVVDGDSTAGPSPVQLLVMALAGCMAIDVVDIVRKGRHAMTGLRATITGERRPEPPRRLIRVELRFHLRGDVPPHVVERAIQLSRDKYCSVWHSLRDDIELATGFEIAP
ncbi:MAG TPA: OsmC family protein [Vicinamibacterales bacterium]|nr:OsmC family protein [Vicinamibacterales bacterium]